MASVMTKRGQQDNEITYEHICDKPEDMSKITPAYITLGSICIILEGDVPSPIEPPNACRFAGRCRYAKDICRNTPPALKEILPGHFAACHYAKENQQ